MAEQEPLEQGPVAFAALGKTVLVRQGDRLAEWTEEAGLQPIPDTTPDQYMKFVGGYIKDPDPLDAEDAVRAWEESPPEFTDANNLNDPDVLDMRGPRPK